MMLLFKIILILATIFTSIFTNFFITSGSINHDREKVTSSVRVIVPSADRVSLVQVTILGSHTLILSWSVYGIARENHSLVTSLALLLWTLSFNMFRHHHVRMNSSRIWLLSGINFSLLLTFFLSSLLVKIFKKKRLHISCYFLNMDNVKEHLEEEKYSDRF